MKLCHIVLAGLLVAMLSACSTTKETELQKSNLRRQVALQGQLQKLNKQNETLRKTLTESEDLNRENADLIDNSLTKENTPELEQLLKEFKEVNEKTQVAIDSFKRSIRDDAEKNAAIEQMLDGFAVECQQQQSRLDQIEDTLGTNRKIKKARDNVHIGISAQYMAGPGSLVSDESNIDNEYDFSGTTRTAYFTYAGDHNAALGLKYMTQTGKLNPKTEQGNDAYLKTDSTLGLVSIGYRIPTVETFNIVPELLYGAGEIIVRSCVNDSCPDDTYHKSSLRALGLEIPFYHHLNVAFSWGFKLSAYRMTAENADYFLDGSKQNSTDTKTEITVAGLGVMAGLAW